MDDFKRENEAENGLVILKELTGEIGREDLKQVIEDFETMLDKVRGNTLLADYLDDVKLMGLLVRDYYNGDYKKIPYRTIAIATFALLYIINPGDIIPEELPFLGKIDGPMVLGLALLAIHRDLKNYREWKIAEDD
ncbi:MAG: YkvA family protein [bacterium]